MNVVQELIDTLRSRRLSVGDTPDQAEKYINGYLRGLLETICTHNQVLRDSVAWHIKFNQNLQ